jgi:hypothetical protein
MLCLQTQRDYHFKLILLDEKEFKFTYKVEFLFDLKENSPK